MILSDCFPSVIRLESEYLIPSLDQTGDQATCQNSTSLYQQIACL